MIPDGGKNFLIISIRPALGPTQYPVICPFHTFMPTFFSLILLAMVFNYVIKHRENFAFIFTFNFVALSSTLFAVPFLVFSLFFYLHFSLIFFSFSILHFFHAHILSHMSRSSSVFMSYSFLLILLFLEFGYHCFSHALMAI